MVVTFVPYPSIDASLATLDKRRLGKQRVEARQIIHAIEGKTRGWSRHPAVLMWQGYLPFLIAYYNRSLEMWEERGGRNVLLHPISPPPDEPEVAPWWWGWEPLHESHKASLKRKDPVFYENIPLRSDHYLEVGYLWPSNQDAHGGVPPLVPRFEQINPAQKIPPCNHPPCRFPGKYDGWCGVHNPNKKRVAKRTAKKKKLTADDGNTEQ